MWLFLPRAGVKMRARDAWHCQLWGCLILVTLPQVLVGGVEAFGGADGPEDVAGGLQVCGMLALLSRGMSHCMSSL